MPDSSLAPFDAQLAAGAVLKNLVNGATIPFQFAPRVTSQSNTSLWLEKDLWSIEPLKIHKGSGGKKLSIEWEYIATDTTFTGAKIAQIIRDLNAYFFEFRRGTYPLVQFSFGEVVPNGPNFRLMQADVSYGPEIAQNGGKAYYVYTKVSASLEMASNLKAPAGGTGQPKLTVQPVKSISPQWY